MDARPRRTLCSYCRQSILGIRLTRNILQTAALELVDYGRVGRFSIVREITETITAYLSKRNDTPKPCSWKASAKEIPAKPDCARRALEAGRITKC